ncbi:MAG: AAA family ATPase [Nanoarchaeota archaeon]
MKDKSSIGIKTLFISDQKDRKNMRFDKKSLLAIKKKIIGEKENLKKYCVGRKNSMKRPKFVFAGGINGSGKTTVLNLVVTNNKEISLIKGSEFFMKWLGIKMGDYKTLQKLPDREVLSEQSKMIRHLVNKESFGKSKKIIIIDAHFINIRNGKAQEWVGDWMSMMHAMILIKANSKDVLRRIKSDEKKSTRDRNIFTKDADSKYKIKSIETFNKKSEQVFKRYARMYNKPNKTFLNGNEQFIKVAENISRFLRSI